MGKKKSILLWLVCGILWLFSGTAFADTMGGAVHGDNGQTEIVAGVVVNYMGKLRFEVYQKDTNIPIPGASVELYISSLDRYVLLGVTDEYGVYELDVAYDMGVSHSGGSGENQFVTTDGTITFQGSVLYLTSNEINYQIYKAEWLPYPHQGNLILELKEIPQKVVVYLYQKGKGGDDSGSTGSSKDPGGPGKDIPDKPGQPDKPELGSIPKTGVEGAMEYWAGGLLFFLMAGGILWYLIREEGKIKEKERRSQNETV